MKSFSVIMLPPSSASRKVAASVAMPAPRQRPGLRTSHSSATPQASASIESPVLPTTDASCATGVSSHIAPAGFQAKPVSNVPRKVSASGHSATNHSARATGFFASRTASPAGSATNSARYMARPITATQPSAAGILA